MDSNRIFPLIAPRSSPQGIEVNHSTGGEFPAGYLSFKLVNKQSRVRLSEKSFEYSRFPGKSRLLSIGNRREYFAAALRKDDGYYLTISPLSELHKATESSPAGSEALIQFMPQKSPSKLPGTPHILTFTCNNEYIIIAFLEGPIVVYDVNIFLQGTEAKPFYFIPESPNTVARDIVSNPEENPECVAILRETQNHEYQVDIIDIRDQKHVVGWRQVGADVIPVSICWSPKGKQFGIGLLSGDVLLYSLATPEMPKSYIAKPSSVSSENSALLSVTWISNTTWHLVFSAPDACFTNFDPSSSSLMKTHIVIMIDSKTKATTTVELIDPSPPFGAQIAPGPVAVVLRNWDPAKYILVCGDGPSADIGVIGSSAGDSWMNFSLEETSTPSLPLDDDMQDMPLLGLELDLTSREPISISEQPDDDTPVLPPSPILYAYLSDGTIIAWYILNSNGNRYPGMVGAMEPSTPLLVQRPDAMETPPSGSPKADPAPSNSPFGQQATSSPSFITPAQGFGAFSGVTTSSKFGGTGFGSSATSTFTLASQTENSGGLTSTLPSALSGFPAKTPVPTFGTTGFGMKPAPPTFGAPGFGVKPVFGQSGFASFSNTPKPASAPSSGGFATFAGQGSSGFGVQGSVNILEAEATTPFTKGAQDYAPPQSAFGAGGVGQAIPTLKSASWSNSEGNRSQSATPFGAQAQSPILGSTKPSPPVSSQAGFGGTSTPKTSMDDDDFGGFAGFKGALNSTPTPPVLEDSPPGSPSSPTISPQDVLKTYNVSETAKPMSAYIKPASGFGATDGSSKKPTSSFMKPAQGFGAFSAVTSTFPASTEDKKSNLVDSTSVKPITTGPVFGSTTPLGNRHPSFGIGGFGGKNSTLAVNDSSKPITGGFSAFSTGNGFASYANASGGKSFSELLSSSDSDLHKPTSAPLAFGATPAHSETEKKLVNPSPKPVSIFGVTRDEKEGSSKNKKETALVETSRIEQEPSSVAGSISQASSFSLLSLSETLSQKDQEQNEGATVESPVEEKGQQGNSEKESITSEEFYVTESAYEEGEMVDEELIEHKSGPSSTSSASDPAAAAKVPLPKTPSPAATPTPLTPEASSTELTTLEESSPQSKPPMEAEILDGSTTPPDSPQKPISPSNLQAPVALKGGNTPPFTLSPVGSAFGLGRPSSRPIRSSPLANAPITNNEEEAPESTTNTVKVEQTQMAVPTKTPYFFSLDQSSPLAQAAPSVPSAPRRTNTPPLFGNPSSIPVTHLQTQSSAPPVSTSPQQMPFFASEGRSSPPTASPLGPQRIPPTLQEPLPTPQPGLHPLQAEFLRAYEEVNGDLTKVDELHKFMLQTYPGMHPSRGGLEAIVKEDREFIVNPMYSLVEAQAFRSIIDRLRTELSTLMNQGKANKQHLQTLQNLALISDVKQEELLRWVRAKKDPEFAKTLRPRTLGPEHAENQIKLRKALQIAHQRVQQCEDELEGFKKKLEQEKSGRLGLRPPTLDTIDRTCRNIQLALDEQAKVLNQLSNRIDAMSPQTSRILKSSQVSSPRASSVTPPFASLAAAALNSERSALKLRDALLNARKRPLHTMVTMKPENPVSLDISPPIPPLEWQLPPMTQMGIGLSTEKLSTSSSAPISGSASRRRGLEKKSHAVPLKNNTVSTPSNSKPAFDWGPLPGVAPMKTIPSNVQTPKA